ncbi:hypothetical protein [Prosthecobacter fluviatilis]|uniref:Uncharacterized protein n=1 Tax=Prosthecobacter fluviatilis TaxID=445931 RepID=A0ABW0KZQ3_9BACT
MIVESLLAVVGTITAAFVWENLIRDRVKVSRIKSANDKEVAGLIDLYTTLFTDDGTNYSCEELLEFTNPNPNDRHLDVENIVLTASHHNDVVGFLMCHFYRHRRKAIVSYFGINKEVREARRKAADLMLSYLKKVLLDAEHHCDFLFFDMQGVEGALPQNEITERRARPVKFRQSAKALGMKAVIFDFPYRCPRISLSPEAKEYSFTLMCVPLRTALPKYVSRELLLSFLRFIYEDCYGDVYPISDPRFIEHHKYLKAKLKEYESTLPEQILTR